MATVDNKRLRKKKARKASKAGGVMIENQNNIEKNHHHNNEAQMANNNVENGPSSQPQAKLSETSSIRSLSPEDQQINEEEAGFLLRNSYPTHPSPEPNPLANNPYLNREKCLLCQRDRTEDDESDSEDEELKIGPHNYALSQMSLWVCAKCKATLEEEERKGMTEPSFLNEEIEPDPNALKFLSELQFSSSRGVVDEDDLKSCECEACKDRRLIEREQEEENSKLQKCWAELLHAIRCIYRDNEKCLTDKGGTIDKERCKKHVARLCGRDSHQLYQRLESHSIDYILEVKGKLLQQLTQGHDSPEKAKLFVSLMLKEYDSLCSSAKILAAIFKQLESEHLKRFNLNWELHDKHIFRSIVFGDAVLRSALPMLITQLRLGAATKEMYVEDSYPSVLHRYLTFDDEMSVVGSVYIDCQIRLNQYSDQQAAMQAKQKMLREDWEFFSAQRKILKDTIMKNQSSARQATKTVESEIPIYPTVTTSSSSCIEYKTTTVSTNGETTKCLESQLAEAMRNLLDYPSSTKFTCPNCKKRKCPCQHCAVTHLIACGVLAPELQDILLPLTAPNGCCLSSNSNPFTIPSSSIGFDPPVKAPSVSSTESSSDVDSDGPASGYASTDSWDEKLKMNPDINLFEEFLKDASREKSLLKKGDRGLGLAGDLDSVAPNDLSEPSACQCPECKKPLCVNNSNSILPGSTSNVRSNVTSGQSSTFPAVPVTTIPKPAALHLYPHIHGSRRLSGGATAGQYGAARLAATGSLSAAHYEAVIQPHLYNLQNNNSLASQSHLAKQIDKLKQQQKEASLSAFSAPPFTSAAPLQPCIKDQLKSKHSCALTDHSRSLYNLNSLDTPPHFSSLGTNYNNYKFPDVSNYTSTTRINASDLLTAPPPPFNPSAFSLDSMLTANVPHVTNNATRATKLHSWQMMAQQVQPSCLIAYPDAADSDTPHEHTDECFKHLRGPLNHTSHTSTVSTSAASLASAAAKNLDLYNKLSSCFTPVTSSAAKIVASSGEKQTPPSSSNKPAAAHSTNSCVTSSAKHELTNSLPSSKTKTANPPTTCQHLALNKGKISTSTAASKAHESNKASQKSERRGNLQHHHPAGSSSSQSLMETGGSNSPLISDDDDSGQSSSTSASNTKESNKYCDCCYCEFFGHAQPTTAPISKNYVEVRDRLRLRLKKKNQNSPCSNSRALVPMDQLNSLADSSTNVKTAAALAMLQSKDAGEEGTVAIAGVDGTVAIAGVDASSSSDYPAVEDLLEFITGEPVTASEKTKLDKKQKRKVKKAEQRARKLEQMQRLPSVERKSSVSDSESDGDTDSDLILAQLESMSSVSHRQQQAQLASRPSARSKDKPSTSQPQSKKAKKESGLRVATPQRQKSQSPEADQGKQRTPGRLPPVSTEPPHQQSVKPSQKRSTSKDDKSSNSALPEPLNNTKSATRQSSPLGRQTHRTHSNPLGQQPLGVEGGSSRTPQQAASRALGSRSDEKKNQGQRRAGDAAASSTRPVAERSPSASTHEAKKSSKGKGKMQTPSASQQQRQMPSNQRQPQAGPSNQREPPAGPSNQRQPLAGPSNQKQPQAVPLNQREPQAGPSNQRQQPEGQEDVRPRTRPPAARRNSSDADSPPPPDAPVGARRVGRGGAGNVDDIFMPIDDEEFDNEDDKDVNAFKRFVLENRPPRAKMSVNVNMKFLQQRK